MNQDNSPVEKNRTEDADEYSLLMIESQSYGPNYMIKITDGPGADGQIEYADTVRIAGVNVAVSGEAEIECKEWRIVDRRGSRRALVIGEVDNQPFEQGKVYL